MAFSAGKIVITMLTINFLLLFGGIGLDNSSVMYYFYTYTGSCDFATANCDGTLTFGTDKIKTGSEGSVTDQVNNLKDLGDPVETSFFGSVLEGIRFIAGFIGLLVSFAVGGLVLFAYSSGIPIFFYAFIMPMQIMYIIALFNLAKGGSL